MVNKIHKIRGWDKKLGVWVYGISPWVYDHEAKSKLNMSAFWCRVIDGTISNDSVSQYAGYADKDGRDVYAGDKIQYNVVVNGMVGPMLSNRVSVSFFKNSFAVNMKVISE